jgi:DNA-binding transcriptional regulator YiaG
MRPDELKRIRSRLGLTQTQLAVRLGVTQNTVARWEIGDRRITPPMAQLIERIAKEVKPKAVKKRKR